MLSVEDMVAYHRMKARADVATSRPYEPRSETASGIIREILAYRGLTERNVMDRDKRTHIVRARQEISYWLRRKAHLSFGQIALRIKRDHTVAIHSYRAYGERHGLPLEWHGINTRA